MKFETAFTMDTSRIKYGPGASLVFIQGVLLGVLKITKGKKDV